MSNSDNTNHLRCPSCAYKMSERELQSGYCDKCGKEFNVNHLIAKQQNLSIQDAKEKSSLFAERVGAIVGVMMIAGGITLICLSRVGPAQLLSGWGISSTMVTLAAIIHHRINEMPMYRVLLGLGFAWLIMGLFLGALL